METASLLCAALAALLAVGAGLAVLYYSEYDEDDDYDFF